VRTPHKVAALLFLGMWAGYAPARANPSAMKYLGVNRQGFKEYLWLKDSSVMIQVPAGEFLMGSPDGTGNDDEHPQRSVYLSDYLVDKYDVTNRQYLRFCIITGHRLPRDPGFSDMPNYLSDYPDYPVVNIFWSDAQAYCQWAGKSLPTEAQWEKAARGDDGRTYPWGNDLPGASQQGNFADKSGKRLNPNWVIIKGYDDGYPHTSPVGAFPAGASPYGCMDMAGNVWNWCAGWYKKTCYQTGSCRDPCDPGQGWNRLQRGGCWYSLSKFLRSANRSWLDPSLTSEGNGFRCAYRPEETSWIGRLFGFGRKG